MSSVQIIVQSTPNPNALKFVLSSPVKTQGKVTYRSATECQHNPLAQSIFSVANVDEVYFFDNYITVTQDGSANWDDMEEQIKGIIGDGFSRHDPNFLVEVVEDPFAEDDDPELAKVNAVLDRTIRPALQMDGGDLAVYALQDNVLTINYQGACGSCPSAAMGTLQAIQGILREEYDPEITVRMAQSYY
jgi:NFU1 iron-sulfur cluster scaffold homolog, mitochondrial